MVISRRVSTKATAFVVVGVVITAPFAPATAAIWLGIVPLAIILWPLLEDLKSPTAIALGHLGVFASCFVLGLHDEHRTVWVTLLATLAAMPLGWVLRGVRRAVQAIGGLILSVLTFSVFAWSTEQLGDEPLSEVPSMLLAGTVAGIFLIGQALRGAKASMAPPSVQSGPPAKPTLPSWARDVTESRQHRCNDRRS